MIRTLGLGAPPFLTNHFAQGQPEILLGRWVMRVIFLIVPCCSHHSHKWLCASPIYPHKIRFIFLILVGLYSLFLHYQESVCSKFLLFLPKHPDCETKWKRGKGKNFQKKTSIFPYPMPYPSLPYHEEITCSPWVSRRAAALCGRASPRDPIYRTWFTTWFTTLERSLGSLGSMIRLVTSVQGTHVLYTATAYYCHLLYHYCIFYCHEYYRVV